MNFKTLIKIMAVAMALVAALSFASCDKDPEGGDMTEQSGVSKGETNNKVEKGEDAEFTGGYYNWIYSTAFKGFTASIKKTTIPAELEEAFSSLTEEKKISQLRNVFCSQEVVAAMQTVSEYENRKDKYTHDVVSLKKNTKGIYVLKMNIVTGTTKTEKTFELSLSEKSRAVKLTCYDGDGNELYFHEIVATTDGFIAVNRASAVEDKWSSLQLLFKAEGEGEGYCVLASDLTEKPKSVYTESVYAGFAGKN